MKYNLLDRTSENMKLCAGGGCPAIYEEKNILSGDMQCVGGACPQISKNLDSYLIVGEQLNPSDFEGMVKVGEGEVLIKVPKRLIDEREK